MENNLRDDILKAIKQASLTDSSLDNLATITAAIVQARIDAERERIVGIVNSKKDGGAAADDCGPAWNQTLDEIISQIVSGNSTA